MTSSKDLKAVLQLLKCISVTVAFSTYLMQKLLFSFTNFYRGF